VDVSALEAQLSETETVFVELQDRYGQLERELSTSRRVAATRQLRLSALERRLSEIEARTRSAEELLADERTTRYRVEWLFIGLVATLLLFMILAGVV
jgi:chromosome segregation ATPase